MVRLWRVGLGGIPFSCRIGRVAYYGRGFVYFSGSRKQITHLPGGDAKCRGSARRGVATPGDPGTKIIVVHHPPSYRWDRNIRNSVPLVNIDKSLTASMRLCLHPLVIIVPSRKGGDMTTTAQLIEENQRRWNAMRITRATEINKAGRPAVRLA